MRKFIILILFILLVGCDVQYWGLTPDTVLIDGYVDLDEGYVRVSLMRKCSNSPVTSALVLLNGIMLNSDTPGIYSRNIPFINDTFRLRVELKEDLLNFAEVAPSPRHLNYQYLIEGDSLRLSWERPENADYFEFIATTGGDTILDTTIVDTEIVIEYISDSLRAEIISISGPVWSDSIIIPNIDTGMWRGYFKVISHTYLDFNHRGNMPKLLKDSYTEEIGRPTTLK